MPRLRRVPVLGPILGPVLGPVLATILAAGQAAAQPATTELPPEIVEATDQVMADCEALGGTPSVLPAFDTRLDLNGDGIPDHLIDLAGLQCVDAWSAFCGSAGCPVSVWLSRGDGGFARVDFGHVQAVEITDGAGGRPAVRAFYHGAFCGEGAAGVDGCTRIWSFAGDAAPTLPPIEGAPAVAEAPGPAPAPVTLAPAGPVAPGWTLRDVPDGSPVALGGGTGEIAWLAGFCLAGQPFLAIRLDPPRDAAVVRFGFAFSEGALSVDGLHEPDADGAHVVTLAESPLPARLAGRDSQVAVTVDDAPAGVLSLNGSTRSLRAALADCHGF